MEVYALRVLILYSIIMISLHTSSIKPMENKWTYVKSFHQHKKMYFSKTSEETMATSLESFSWDSYGRIAEAHSIW